MNIEAIAKTVESVDPTTVAIGLGLTGAVAMAFTSRVRKIILERDRECQWESEDSLDHYGRLEAAHYNHDKSNSEYNSPSNGRMLCTFHHWQDHVENTDNGLSENGNNSAIRLIAKRLDSMWNNETGNDK